MRKAATLAGGNQDLPEPLGYSIKRRLLGPPLVNEQLTAERPARALALGVLSCDGISSAAYGSEEILVERSARSFLPRWLTKRGHRLMFSSGGPAA